MKRVSLVREDGSSLLDLELAETAWERAVGLLGRRGLPPGTGMWLAPTRSIHTWGMRFAIDLVFLDDGLRVTKLYQEVRPWRLLWGGRRARVAVELAAGEVARLGIEPGQQVALRAPTGR